MRQVGLLLLLPLLQLVHVDMVATVCAPRWESGNAGLHTHTDSGKGDNLVYPSWLQLQRVMGRFKVIEAMCLAHTGAQATVDFTAVIRLSVG